MKAELTLPQELVNEIAAQVVERLKPILSGTGKAEDDVIFTPKTLAKYLQVDTSWVYKQVSFKAIPYFKSGKYTRFKKRVIDKWIETQTVRPILPLRLIKNING